MTRPVRLRLLRRKGFNLQALSIATNGLPAVNVTRPSKWGNPYRVGAIDRRTGGIMDAETAVERFLDYVHQRGGGANIVVDLAGKNLACWCRPGAPCHADVLLELANPEPGA